MMKRFFIALAALCFAASAHAQLVPLGPRFVLPYQNVVDPNGVPFPGAQLFFYQSGTQTKLNTYSDPLLQIPNSNPVVANAAGVFPNIFLDGNYKVILKDSLNNQIWAADPVYGLFPGELAVINPIGPTYQAQCNQIITSLNVISSLTITLPPASAAASSCMVYAVIQSGKPITINGGGVQEINLPFGPSGGAGTVPEFTIGGPPGSFTSTNSDSIALSFDAFEGIWLVVGGTAVPTTAVTPPADYPFSSGNTYGDVLATANGMTFGHSLPWLDGNNTWTGGGVYPQQFVGSNPYVGGATGTVVCATPCTGSTFQVTVTGDFITNSPVAVPNPAYVATSVDTPDTIKVQICTAFLANANLYSRTTSLPMFCDSNSPGVTAEFNIAWSEAVDPSGHRIMLSSTGTGTINGLGTINHALDFVVYRFGRFVPGYLGQNGDGIACWQMAGQDSAGGGNDSVPLSICGSMPDNTSGSQTAQVSFQTQYDNLPAHVFAISDGISFYDGNEPNPSLPPFEGLGSIAMPTAGSIWFGTTVSGPAPQKTLYLNGNSGTGAIDISGPSSGVQLGHSGTMDYNFQSNGFFPTTNNAYVNGSSAFSWSGVYSYTYVLRGSSTGATAVASANASASNYSIFFPAASGTVAVSATSPITLSGTGAIACPTCTVSSSTNIFTAPQIVDLGSGTGEPTAGSGSTWESYGADGAVARDEITAFNNAVSGSAAIFDGRTSLGTRASPSTVTSGTLLASFEGKGYDTSVWTGTGASFHVYAEGTWTTSSHPGEGCIQTTASGATATTDQWCIHQDGGATLGSPTGGDEGANTLNLAGLLYNNGVAPTGTGGYVLANSPTLVTPNLGTPSAATLTNATGLPISTGVSGLGTGVATLLAGASSGTGGPAGTTSPSFTTPTLGVATATTINKVTITAPATGATLTIANGKTLTINNSIAFTGTDSTTMTLPTTSKTLAATDFSNVTSNSLGNVTITGALKGNGSGTISQAASSDLSDTGAWSTFTPTIVCGTGSVTTYTTQNGRYKVYLGKTIAISVNIKVNNAGSCSGTIAVASLPVTAGSNNYTLNGFDGTTNAPVSALIIGGQTSGIVTQASGSNPGATDVIDLGGIYETN